MAWFRCGGGEIQQSSGGSVILAENPTITLTKSSSNSVTITWAKPSSEVTIAKYQVYKYKSTTAPTTLSQMTLVGSTTNLTYTVENLNVPSTYFFVVTTVTSDDYENASIKGKQSIGFSSRGFVIKASNGVFASSDLINWTNVTDKVGNSSVVTTSSFHISYAEGAGFFYTDGDVYVSEDGFVWTYKKLPDVAIPNGTTSKATSIGVRKHDFRPLLGIAAPGGTTFFTGVINEDWYKVTAMSTPDSDLWWVYGNPKYFTTAQFGDSTLQDGATVYGYPKEMYSHKINGGYVEYIVCEGNYGVGLYVYKRVITESSSFSQVYSRNGGIGGADSIYGFAVSPKNEKDKDILVISIVTGLIYSFDSGKNWNYESDIITADKLTYDSAENKFIAFSNGSEPGIYECNATKEALSSNTWKKISVSSDTWTEFGKNVEYIIGK